MYLSTQVKAEIFRQYSPAAIAEDTGSPESQIALFTRRINHLTDHLKQAPKDKSTQNGLLRLVGKRRKLLAYLQNTEIERYRSIIKLLGIRR
jgi:small subunit ribosomal protein S15